MLFTGVELDLNPETASNMYNNFKIIVAVLGSGASPNRKLFLGPAERHGNKDTIYMALSGGRCLVIPHKILSLYPEKFFLRLFSKQLLYRNVN